MLTLRGDEMWAVSNDCNGIFEVRARRAVSEIGDKKQALELTVFPREDSNDYQTYYIGKPEEGMDAFGREDLHLGLEPGSWWGWGLLENWEGNTTEHYRPHNYG